MFVGRKKELDALNSRYKSNRKEFGVLYGRRRIGKSSILNEFLKDKDTFNKLGYKAKINTHTTSYIN